MTSNDTSGAPQGRWWLIFLALTCFLLVRLHREYNRAPLYGMEPAYDSEDRVNIWLLSALCFQKTRIPLVICGEDGRIHPIEDIPVADDRGHAIVATVVALFRSSPVTRVTLVKINLGINAVGIFLLACVWMVAGMRWSSILTLVLGCRYGLPGPLPGHDAPASYFGIFCLVALVVIWVVACDLIPVSKRMFWAGAALSFVSLAWACLLRQPIGMVGVLTTFLLLIAPALWDRNHRPARLKKLVVGGLLVSIAMCATPAVLKLRNLVFHVPEAHFYHSHGIWHSLYLGLGWVPNPWGIVWDDRYGAEVVKRIHPATQYGSNEYFRTMKELYWQILTRNPWSVLKVYGQKFLQTWNFPLLILGIRISRWFLAAAVLALILIRSAKLEEQLSLKIVLSLGVLYLVFSMQGVLGIPTGTHLYPLKFCVLLMISVWADYLSGFLSPKR